MEDLQPLPIIDDRTPEQLKADGDDVWPDGTPYNPPSIAEQLANLEETITRLKKTLNAVTSNNQRLTDDNLRLAQNKLAIIAFSEDCFLLIRDLIDCYEQTKDVATVIEALREVQERGAQLFPYLVPQKESA